MLLTWGEGLGLDGRRRQLVAGYFGFGYLGRFAGLCVVRLSGGHGEI